jgi:hypothetical protein
MVPREERANCTRLQCNIGTQQPSTAARTHLLTLNAKPIVVAEMAPLEYQPKQRIRYMTWSSELGQFLGQL